VRMKAATLFTWGMARMIAQMRKTSRAFYGFTLMASAVLVANAAEAQTVGWVDRMFTFREDQKKLLTPGKRATAPKAVYQPYYDERGHEVWSSFYTRTDLEPTDYLSSSASKVMRERDSNALGQGGWEAIEAQGQENLQASAPSITIGDPGEGPGMQYGDGRVGRETKISAPIRDWREGAADGLASRPGDFDYRTADVNRPPLEENGIIRSETLGGTKSVSGNVPLENNPLRHDSRYLEFNYSGQVTRYQVQKGDTLGNISAQPAIYGKEARWPLIYSANKTAIGGNPNNLKVKQKLVIPRDFTEAQAKEAEKKAK
jgi:nucleoid-associated protein YgaU